MAKVTPLRLRLRHTILMHINVVAGVGFEPTTFGL